MRVRQARLKSGSTVLSTWLDSTVNLKRGLQLTLKGDERVWTVVELYDTIVDKQSLHRGWPSWKLGK